MTTANEIRAACPVCNGEGRVFRMTPGYEAMAVAANGNPFSWIGTTHEWRLCKPCSGTGLLPPALPPAGEIHALGTCVPVDAERLAEALIPVTRGVWSTPTQRNPDRQSEQDRRWRLNTAAAILAALAKPQEANHA